MKTPCIPHNEASRLQALRSLNILDTKPEERFDRFTRVARRMFDVPIALVCLVDEHRQWFKSVQGLSFTETPRDISFCTHAILGDLVMVIPDAALDERFVGNPLVNEDPRIRFYAGCPLRAPDGSHVGTLCILDHVPRNIGLLDLEALVDLAGRVERELATGDLDAIDRLTGISGPGGFLTLAERSLKLCASNKRPASLVVVDLDEFKSLNFVHGRIEGDRVLRGVGRAIRRTFTNTDVFGRIGEDEFAGLLTNTTHESALELVGAFKDSFASLVTRGNAPYALQFSEAIVTVQHENDYSLDGLLSRARNILETKKLARLDAQSHGEAGQSEARLSGLSLQPGPSVC